MGNEWSRRRCEANLFERFSPFEISALSPSPTADFRGTDGRNEMQYHVFSHSVHVIASNCLSFPPLQAR